MIDNYLHSHYHEIVYCLLPVMWGAYFYGMTLVAKHFSRISAKQEHNGLVSIYYYIVVVLVSLGLAWFIPGVIGQPTPAHEVKIFLIFFIPGFIGVKIADRTLCEKEKKHQEKNIEQDAEYYK